jgi:hypothetical protein
MIDNGLTSAIIGNRPEEYDDASANVKGIVVVAARGKLARHKPGTTAKRA